MVKVGITGGIGSGKSTVCEVWSKMGGYVLNADKLAKELMTTDEQLKAELTEIFGNGAYKADGSLDRDYLAEEAFRKGRVAELNAIVHPRLPAVVRRKMDEAFQKGYEVGIYEAALLLELEEERLDFFDYLVLVLADEERRLHWVSERDDSSPEEVKDRMRRQRNFEESTGRADIIIRNNSSLDDLKERAEQVFQKFLSPGR